MSDSYCFHPIGRVRSPFKEKFGIPRQPGLVNIPASIEILPEFARAEAFRGLQAFSHLWISFVFHEALREQWKPMVRPPRLGGNDKVGVFASRSMFRPNPLGLSVVALADIRETGNGLRLDIIGADMLDGTPVLDIKPYLPYVDSVPGADAGYADEAPSAKLQVVFADHLEHVFQQLQNQWPQLQSVITEVLQYDPRPAYRSDEQGERIYSMHLYDFDVKWRVQQQRVEVIDLVAV
jgi:tRNA-Thr(GGU) m(6)t(6)A37 methyltransferase TsaA